METPVQRVLAWREQKRRQGYQPMTIWLTAAVKHRMEDLAAQRREDLGALLTAAFEAWLPARRGGSAPPTLDALVRQKVEETMATHWRRVRAGLPSPLETEPEALQRAVEQTARRLGQFTATQMVEHLGSTHAQVRPILDLLRTQGILRKPKHSHTYTYIDLPARP
jgi:hypothetical protein